MAAAPSSAVSPQLGRVLNALRGHVRDTDNPAGAARALLRVAGQNPLPHESSRAAFGIEAERLLSPFFHPMLNDGEVGRLIDIIQRLAVPPETVNWDTLSRTFVGGWFS